MGRGLEQELRKERKDGLYLDRFINTIDEKKHNISLQSRIVQLVAILIGGWGSFGVLMEILATPADYLLVNVAILSCTVAAFVLCFLPSFDLVKLFFGCLFYGLYIYSRHVVLLNGFYILENQVIARLADYYMFPKYEYVADYATAVQDSTHLLVMVVIPVITLLTIAIVRNHLGTFAGAILFLPITASFIFGLIPSERYLLAYLISTIYLAKSSFAVPKRMPGDQIQMLHRINSKAAVILTGISILVFLLLKLFFPEQKYESLTMIEKTKNDVQSAMLNFSWEDFTDKYTNQNLFYIQSSSGGLDGGKLGNVAKVKFSDSEQLIVTAAYDALANGFYLKGYVGNVYTGHSWVGYSDEMNQDYEAFLNKLEQEQVDFNTNNQVPQLFDRCAQIGIISGFLRDQMQITYVDANKKFLYLPYFTDMTITTNIKYHQDLYASPQKKKESYSVKYYDFTSLIELFTQNNMTLGSVGLQLPDVAEIQNYGKDYRDYVYETYRRIPDKGCEKLIQDFSIYATAERVPNAYQMMDASNAFEKIQYIKNYLAQNTTYSLSPGKLPKGEDFVEYFLYTNKKGYCAHYASAATLILRAMGVPARYVEGYFVSSDDIGNNIKRRTDTMALNQVIGSKEEVEVSVLDRNAHAWVEVYIDHLGWVPYDFTPSDNSNTTQNQGPNATISPTQAPSTPTPQVKQQNTPIPKDKTNQDNINSSKKVLRGSLA